MHVAVESLNSLLKSKASPSVFAGGYPHAKQRNAGVAQLVEHLICNQRVGGSTPSASSIKSVTYRVFRRLIDGLVATTLKRERPIKWMRFAVTMNTSSHVVL